MMRIPVLAVSAVLALGLGACQSTPVYAPQATASGSGYSEQRLDERHYQVFFTGRRSTSREEVEAGLLLRAAEVTAQAGYSHFRIDSRDTETEVRSSYVPYGPYGAYGGWGWGYGWGWGRRGWGLGGYYDPFWYDYHVYDDSRFVALADITLLTAAEARSTNEAIDAEAVIANLRPQLVPPPPPQQGPA